MDSHITKMEHIYFSQISLNRRGDQPNDRLLRSTESSQTDGRTEFIAIPIEFLLFTVIEQELNSVPTTWWTRTRMQFQIKFNSVTDSEITENEEESRERVKEWKSE